MLTVRKDYNLNKFVPIIVFTMQTTNVSFMLISSIGISFLFKGDKKPHQKKTHRISFNSLNMVVTMWMGFSLLALVINFCFMEMDISSFAYALSGNTFYSAF